MESHFMIYLLVLVKVLHSQQVSVYNGSRLHSIIVIKKHPYGDIIIKSETVNMNSTSMFDDVKVVNASAGHNVSSEYVVNAGAGHNVSSEYVVNVSAGHNVSSEYVVNVSAGHNVSSEYVVNASAGHNLSSEYVDQAVNSSSYSRESNQDLRYSLYQPVTSCSSPYNLTSNSSTLAHNISTRRRSMIRRLFDRLL